MSLEADVSSHYTHGALEGAILSALRSMGKDIAKLQPDDLAGADEFHTGWRPATVDLAADLELSAASRVLDIGSGLGGPARYMAATYGCHVTGIDLTEEYVDVANALTLRCGLADRVTFVHASALELPFKDAQFDRATLIHVGMNIEDKARLFAEARRVLAPGGLFCVYDLMLTGTAPVPYPMPWAHTAGTSFLATPDAYRDLVSQAGFTVVSEKNRREMALRLGREMGEKAARDGPPPLGLHTLMGPATPERIGNVMAALAQGTIAPVQLLARAA